jgi:hypothetical protein
MSRRRITFTLGTAAGALVAAAFLPIAVAFADADGFYLRRIRSLPRT